MENNKQQGNQNYRKENVVVSVPLVDIKTYNRYFDDPDGVKQTLDEINWDLMAFPVIVYRKHVTGNPEMKGTSTIGAVNSFDKENNNFIISVFGKYEDVVSEFEDIVVMPRVTLSASGRSIVVGLIVSPLSDFEWMLRPNNNQKGNRR